MARMSGTTREGRSQLWQAQLEWWCSSRLQMPKFSTSSCSKGI